MGIGKVEVREMSKDIQELLDLLGKTVYRLSPFNHVIQEWEITSITFAKYEYFGFEISRHGVSVRKNLNDIGDNVFFNKR